MAEFVAIDKHRVVTVPHPTDTQTVDHLALLPLSALQSRRAVRTLQQSETLKGTHALVLHGHDGPGAIVIAELTLLGVKVTAQVPSATTVADGVERAKRFGAERVVSDDDPVVVLKGLEAGGFDFVVDTVGGRGVWTEAQRVLNSSGQVRVFISLFVCSFLYIDCTLFCLLFLFSSRLW